MVFEKNGTPTPYSAQSCLIRSYSRLLSINMKQTFDLLIQITCSLCEISDFLNNW